MNSFKSNASLLEHSTLVKSLLDRFPESSEKDSYQFPIFVDDDGCINEELTRKQSHKLPNCMLTVYTPSSPFIKQQGNVYAFYCNNISWRGIEQLVRTELETNEGKVKWEGFVSRKIEHINNQYGRMCAYKWLYCYEGELEMTFVPKLKLFFTCQ